jgi:hypothetical protein
MSKIYKFSSEDALMALSAEEATQLSNLWHKIKEYQSQQIINKKESRD